MAKKTIVVDLDERTRVPFLRGILTRSLQDAGVPFNDAYKLASAIRHELNDSAEVTTAELRGVVLKQLGSKYGSAVVQRYQSPDASQAAILVRDADGQYTPFSRSQHQRCLESCGVPSDKSTEVTQKMYRHLMSRGLNEIDSPHLGHLTYRCLRADPQLGPEVAHRYLVWVNFLHSGRPLILLLGGTAGCGKSTMATELANHLEIVRTQSTDMLREVMRMMIPKRLLPVLHTSSFNAWKVLPHPEHAADHDALLADGFRTQADLLSVPCEAVVQRALRERVSLILEGVHVQPALLKKIPQENDAIIVPIMLAVLKPEQLRKRIRGRGTDVPQRRSERYLEHFDAIWRLQSFLLSEADGSKVTIVANDNKERAMHEIMRTIIDTLARDGSPDPKDVFCKAGMSSGSSGDSDAKN